MELAGAMTSDFVGFANREHVIAACQQGDREAFRLLFEAHKDRVYAIALHYSGNETAAQDIAQQVFVKLITNIGQFHFQAEFTTWLYRLVANTCFDEQRRWRRLIPFGEAAEVQTLRTSENVEADYARVELSHNVGVAIASLKPKLRLPILLKYMEGMSYEEIAAVLGCSAGTVASRLNRGHKALAKRLEHLREVL